MKTNNVKGYKIDFTARAIIVNYKFSKAMSDVGSPEYNLLKTIQSDFPNMKIVVAAGRKNKTCHHDKNLTYQYMETYISTQDNADELMAAYWIARTQSDVQTSRYAYVRKWFINQFPNYREVQVFERSAPVVEIAAGEKEAA